MPPLNDDAEDSAPARDAMAPEIGKRLRRQEMRDTEFRRYLAASAIMLILLGVANGLLFGPDAWDAAFLGAALLALICLLYQFYWRTMGILRWLWVLLTLPYWLAFLLLSYHLVLGAWARHAYRKSPGKLEIQKTQLTNFWDESTSAFSNPKFFSAPPYQMDERRREVLAGRPIAEILARPEFPGQMERLEPDFQYFQELARQQGNDGYQYYRVEYYNEIAENIDFQGAQWLHIAWMAQRGQVEQAREDYLQMLRMYALAWVLPPYTDEKNRGRIRLLAEPSEYPVSLLEGREQEVLAILEEAHEAGLREAAYAADQRIKGAGLVFNNLPGKMMYLRYGGAPRFAPTWMRGLGPLSDIYDSHVALPLWNRQFYWPFYVREHACERRLQWALAEGDLYGDQQLEAAMKLHKLENHYSEDTKWLKVDPGGFQEIANETWEIRDRPTTEALEYAMMISQLEAYKYALRWRLREPDLVLPVDPLLNRPLFTQTVTETLPDGRQRERLQIAGGANVPTVQWPDIEQIQALERAGFPEGLSYLIEMTRPALPEPEDTHAPATP